MSSTTETDDRQPQEISFEDGYDELKGIVNRLKEDDVPVHEMFEKFRRGKGLEKSLRSYLTEREGELQEIEQGENVPEFRVVAPSKPTPSSPGDGASSDVPSDTAGFERAGPASGGSAADDDIPF